MSSGVREPIAAGTLYPSDPQLLRVEIDTAIKNAESDFASPKVLVLPACGLCAAPEVAGGAMFMLESERDHIDTVVVIADYDPAIGDRRFSGVAVPRAIAFRTPLGDLLVHRGVADALGALPGVTLNDRPFLTDQSIEVHLPPVQRLLGTVKIVPILVGDASPAEVVDVLERVWGDRHTLVIASSFFGEGNDAEVVHELGERAREILRRGDASALTSEMASSPITLAALATITSRRSMGLNELSADVVDHPFATDRFADAGTFGAWESHDVSLAAVDVAHLRALALSTVHLTVLGGVAEGTLKDRIPPALAARRASVVTLRREGETRGSAGTIEADRSLGASVVRNAAAACADPRLPSVQPAELDTIDMSISVVSPIERIFPESWQELSQIFAPGRHGVLVTTEHGRAAQLPAMWARFRDPESFIAAVAQKARLDTGMRVSEAAWYRFETIEY